MVFRYNGFARSARFIVAGLFVSLTAHAQQLEVGLGGGLMAYKGDIAPALDPSQVRPAGTGFFRYNATRSVSFRLGLSAGSFGAVDRLSNDPLQRARNYSFRTSLLEASLDAEYSFFDYRSQRTRKNWSPYVFGGLAVIQFKPTGNTGPEFSRQLYYSFPVGVGVKYEFSRPWGVAAEFGTRFTRTDFLDNLGPRDPQSGKFVQGDPAHKDSYSFLAVTLTYTFYKLVCPPGTRVR
jgi:hypothetical protein